MLISYFDRVNLSVSHEALRASFGMNDFVFGLLSGTYNLTYALCQVPVGVLLDRWGVKRVGRISSLIWTVATFAASMTPNVAGFFGARLLLGVGESPIFPANAKAIGQWFPPEERGLPTAIFDSAAKLASALGVPIIGIVLLHIGWRWSFAATGLLSLGYCAVFFRSYSEPEHAERTEAVARRSSTVGFLLRQPKTYGLALGFGSYNYVFYLLLTWLPSYLSIALHIDLLHSFLYTGAPWLFATFTDLLFGGWLIDALIARGLSPQGVRKSVLLGGSALGLGILGAAQAHSASAALLWISLSIGGLAAAAPVGWSLLSLVAPEEGVGTLGGILNLSNQISGISAPVITGYLVNTRHSFTLVFVIPAIYLLLGLFGYSVLLGPIERMPSPPTQRGAGGPG